MWYRHLPPLNSLKAFVAVAREGSFGAAARQLSINQGAISRHIANLEESLGCTLFKRRRSGAILTSEGQSYFSKIEPALTMISEATMEQRTVVNGIKILRITTYSSFGLRWLIPRLHKFQALNPGILIDLETSDMLPNFASEGRDAAIIARSISQLTTPKQNLGHERMVVICSQDFAHKNSMQKPNDLYHLPLIHTTTCGHLWQDWFSHHCNALPNPIGSAMGFQDFYLSIEAARVGIGVALVPDILVADTMSDEGLRIPIKEDLLTGRCYQMIKNRQQEQEKASLKFENWLRDEISKNIIKYLQSR